MGKVFPGLSWVSEAVTSRDEPAILGTLPWLKALSSCDNDPAKTRRQISFHPSSQEPLPGTHSCIAVC